MHNTLNLENALIKFLTDEVTEALKTAIYYLEET